MYVNVTLHQKITIANWLATDSICEHSSVVFCINIQ